MDTLTHALSGALLARATKKNNTQTGLSLKARIIAGTLAAAFPDIDFIASFFGAITYLDNHRGITHSFIFLPFWALLLSVVFSKLSKGRYQWKDFYLVVASGLAIHILGDVITAYGTMMFAPISATKYAWPTTFIIDLYFTGIIVTALIMAKVFQSHSKKIAVTGLIVLVSYIGYQAKLSQQAEQIAKSYIEKNKLQQAQIYVMPQPLSPYYWKVVVKTAETYHVSYINLLNDKPLALSENAGLFERIRNLYQSKENLQWKTLAQYGSDDPQLAKKVWSLDLLKSIRAFMLFPVVDSVTTFSNQKCIWFKDHRFLLGDVRQVPFVFGACHKDSGWALYRRDNNEAAAL